MRHENPTKPPYLILTATGCLWIGMFLALVSCAASQDPPPPASGPITSQPDWWNDAVFYEVFVRSFYDNDGDGIGDLKGLIAKLDYLNDGDPQTKDDLGVTGIWLMPVMQSPSYHGYDVTDYYVIEEDYGQNADFQWFIAEAHKRGIMVIIDLSLNHTSNQHPWFLNAAGNPGAEKRDWYVWRGDDPQHRTPWGGSVWFPSGEETYYHSIFWEGMPDLNYRNQDVTTEMYRTARFWLEEMDVDGFRLDAVRHLIEKDANYSGTEETHQWLLQWDNFIDEIDPQALTVGEIWDDTSQVVPYVENDEVDIAFEFSLAEGILASIQEEHPFFFGERLAQVLTAYPPGQYAPFLTNHDQNRVMSQLDQDRGAAKLGATILLTLPGVPFIYYGEEIGMTGQKPDELIRTPMQWSSEPGAGFSDAQPWQPVNKGFEQVNVARQTADPDSLLNHYRQLIALRAAQSVLRYGELQSLSASCPETYAYLRNLPADDHASSILVVLNFSADEQRDCAFDLDSSDLDTGSYEVTDLLTGQSGAGVQVGDGGQITGYIPQELLAPRQGAVWLLEP